MPRPLQIRTKIAVPFEKPSYCSLKGFWRGGYKNPEAPAEHDHARDRNRAVMRDDELDSLIEPLRERHEASPLMIEARAEKVTNGPENEPAD
jgi:hypothetical protein